MKIISFDVGIKNMAYCIFETSDSHPFQLCDWNVVSLVDSETKPKEYCNCSNKTKNKKIQEMFSQGSREPTCGNIGKYKKGSQIFCERHAKSQKDWIFLQPKHAIKKLKKMKAGELSEVLEELQILPQKNKGEAIKQIEEKSLEPITKEKTVQCSDAGLIPIGKSMKTVFNQVLENHKDISIVLIENQISPIANRMKTIQGMLAQYFIMLYDPIDIEFISSGNKLKMFSKKEIKDSRTQSQIYKTHKKDGVYHTFQLLDKNPWITDTAEALKESKKQDDFADCFLQGLWYLSKNEYIEIDAENYLLVRRT